MPSFPVTPRRAELLFALNSATQEASGLGVLLSQAIAKRLGLTPAALECLGVIDAAGRISAGDIARATGLTSGAITGILDQLERAGFARRERDPTDRRKTWAVMEPAGRARAMLFYKPIAEAAQRLAGNFDDRDLGMLVDYLRKSSEFARGEVARLNAAPPDEPQPSTPASD